MLRVPRAPVRVLRPPVFRPQAVQYRPFFVEAVSSDPMQAARLVSGHTYVVQGVYSSLENARRALRELERREPALHGRIYLYGPKYMVSMFSSETSEQSIAFVRAYADRYPDLWTYRAK